MNRSKAAFLFSAERLGTQGLYMWTFTFAEVLSIQDTRKKWNHLLTLMRRRWPSLCGLRVFEMHDTHGLHVHLITNRFIDVNEARRLSKQAGWGRIHVMKIPIEQARYLAKYLSKEREPCFKGWRLWAGFGNWNWSRVQSVVLESPCSRVYQHLKRLFEWKGNKNFYKRMQIVDSYYRMELERSLE